MNKDMYETLALSRVVDHLIIASPSLEQGVSYIKDYLGVDAVVGGSHPGLGTCNALVSLGPRCYLEVIAPDPSQPDFDGERPFGINDLTQSRLVGWMAVCTQLSDLVSLMRAKGLMLSDVVEVSRVAPHGELLTWQLCLLAGTNPARLGALPVLIDWLDSPHPAQELVQNAELVSLELYHPDPAQVQPFVNALDLGLNIEQSAEEGIQAVISGPLGSIHLSSMS